MIQRKRTKSVNNISSDLEALRMEDLDSSYFQAPTSQPSLSYASILKDPINRFASIMTEDFDFSDVDWTYSQGKHGLIAFSEKVHIKLDLDGATLLFLSLWVSLIPLILLTSF